MPIMDVKTFKLTKEKKDALAESISEAVLPFIAPHFQIYFNEYENGDIYLNGKQVEVPDALTLSMDGGPELSQEQLDTLAKAVNDAVMKVLNTGTTFIYHPSENKNILLNGKTLASMLDQH